MSFPVHGEFFPAVRFSVLAALSFWIIAVSFVPKFGAVEQSVEPQPCSWSCDHPSAAPYYPEIFRLSADAPHSLDYLYFNCPSSAFLSLLFRNAAQGSPVL